MRKPSTQGEVMSDRSLGAFRGERGSARGDRSVEEPGRPGGAEGKALDAAGEDITLGWPGRESDRPIVAKKRVMIVEPRGPNAERAESEEGRAE